MKVVINSSVNITFSLNLFHYILFLLSSSMLYACEKNVIYEIIYTDFYVLRFICNVS